MKNVPSFLRVKQFVGLGVVALATGNLAGVAGTAHGQTILSVTAADGSSQGEPVQGSPVLIAEGAIPVSAVSPSEASAALPDAPQPQVHKAATPPSTPATSQHIAPLYTSDIPAGYRAQPQNTRAKVIMGARDLYSFDNLAAIVLSAGYEHVTDGEPNYGVNSKAFAQRLGAAAVRETSQGIFTEMILAPAFHEDARYYVLGPSKNVVKRTVYAITRPLITRSDSGTNTINAATLVGYAGAAALTPAYYPQINRNFKDTISTYGASIGGAALGDFVSEFADDVLEAVHLKRLP